MGAWLASWLSAGLLDLPGTKVACIIYFRWISGLVWGGDIGESLARAIGLRSLHAPVSNAPLAKSFRFSVHGPLWQWH